MRRTVTSIALASALLMATAAALPAGENVAQHSPPAVVEVIPGADVASSMVLAQYSQDSGYSSSRSYRLPRGAVKLGIMLIVGVIAGCGWLLKRVFA
jgi:hypothetical protein